MEKKMKKWKNETRKNLFLLLFGSLGRAKQQASLGKSSFLGQGKFQS